MTVQAIIFDKKIYNEKSAKDYLEKHHHIPIKPVHKTLNYLRYRLNDPKKGDKYITKEVNRGVKYVIRVNTH